MICSVTFCIGVVVFFYVSGDLRVLHGLTHFFPTRRSSDLASLPARRPLIQLRLVAKATRLHILLPQGEKELLITSPAPAALRSEEHTSELQSLIRISYAVFCLKKKKQHLLDILLLSPAQIFNALYLRY